MLGHHREKDQIFRPIVHQSVGVALRAVVTLAGAKPLLHAVTDSLPDAGEDVQDLAVSGMGVQMLVAGMITFISLLGVAGDIEALETVVMIGVTLRFTTLLNDIASSLFGMEDHRQMLNSLDEVMGAPEMSVVAKTKGQPKNADITLLGGHSGSP